MDVHGLGWLTDLAILRLGGSEVEERSSYVVVRTPGNPTFRWGNFLLLPAAPPTTELGALEELFVRELPGTTHRAYGVDVPAGDIGDLAPLKAAGLGVEGSVVLTAAALRPPPRPNDSVEVRVLAGDDAWAQRVALDVATNGGDPGGYEEFTRRKAAAERALTESGAGSWWGAYDEGRLVASMGVVGTGGGTARFQEVQTHPEARGRGVAGTLVHVAGSTALAEDGVDRLVTVADPDYHAIRIYRSLGFADAEVQLTAERP